MGYAHMATNTVESHECCDRAAKKRNSRRSHIERIIESQKSRYFTEKTLFSRSCGGGFYSPDIP